MVVISKIARVKLNSDHCEKYGFMHSYCPHSDACTKKARRSKISQAEIMEKVQKIVKRNPKISVPDLTLFMHALDGQKIPISPQGSPNDISHLVRRGKTAVLQIYRGTAPDSTVYAALPDLKVYLEMLDLLQK